LFLVVAYESAGEHEGAEAAFDDPASFDHVESGSGVVWGGYGDHADPEVRAPFGHLFPEALIDPGYGDFAVVRVDLVEQCDAVGVVAQACRGDQDGQDQAEGVRG
jgi:hypothetical protein